MTISPLDFNLTSHSVALPMLLTRTPNIQAVQWKMLLNPDVVPGDIIRLEDTLITGWYKITDLRYTGDWRGGPWYTEVRATAIEKVNKK